MLGAFIRLVDNLFVEGLVAQVVASTKGLLNLLAGQKANEKVGRAALSLLLAPAAPGRTLLPSAAAPVHWQPGSGAAHTRAFHEPCSALGPPSAASGRAFWLA